MASVWSVGEQVREAVGFIDILGPVKTAIKQALRAIFSGAAGILSPIVELIVTALAAAIDPILESAIGLMLYAPAPEMPGSTLFAAPTNSPWDNIFGELWTWMVPLGLVFLFVSYYASEALAGTPLGNPSAGRKREFGVIMGIIAIPMSRYAITLHLNVMQGLTEVLRPPSGAISLGRLASEEAFAGMIVFGVIVGMSWFVYVIGFLVQVMRIAGIVMLSAGTPLLLGLYLGRYPVLGSFSKKALASMVTLSFVAPLTALLFRIMDTFLASDGVEISSLGGGLAEMMFYLIPGVIAVVLPFGMVKSSPLMAAPGALAAKFGSGNAVTDKAKEKGKEYGAKGAKAGKDVAWEAAPDEATEKLEETQGSLEEKWETAKDKYERYTRSEVDPGEEDLEDYEGETVDIEGTVEDVDTRTVQTANGEERSVTKYSVSSESGSGTSEVEVWGDDGSQIEEGDTIVAEEAQVYGSQRPDGKQEYRASTDSVVSPTRAEDIKESQKSARVERSDGAHQDPSEVSVGEESLEDIRTDVEEGEDSSETERSWGEILDYEGSGGGGHPPGDGPSGDGDEGGSGGSGGPGPHGGPGGSGGAGGMGTSAPSSENGDLRTSAASGENGDLGGGGGSGSPGGVGTSAPSGSPGDLGTAAPSSENGARDVFDPSSGDGDHQSGSPTKGSKTQHKATDKEVELATATAEGEGESLSELNARIKQQEAAQKEWPRGLSDAPSGSDGAGESSPAPDNTADDLSPAEQDHVDKIYDDLEPRDSDSGSGSAPSGSSAPPSRASGGSSPASGGGVPAGSAKRFESTEIDPEEGFDPSEVDIATTEGEVKKYGTQELDEHPHAEFVEHCEIVPPGGEKGDGVLYEHWGSDESDRLDDGEAVRIENAVAGSFDAQSDRAHPQAEGETYSRLNASAQTEVTTSRAVRPGDDLATSGDVPVSSAGQFRHVETHSFEDVDGHEGKLQYGELLPDDGEAGEGTPMQVALGEDEDEIPDGTTLEVQGARTSSYSTDSPYAHPEAEGERYSAIRAGSRASIERDVSLGPPEVSPGTDISPDAHDRVSTDGRFVDQKVVLADDGEPYQLGEVIEEGDSPGDGVAVKHDLSAEGNTFLEEGEAVEFEGAKVTSQDGSPRLESDGATTVKTDPEDPAQTGGSRKEYVKTNDPQFGSFGANGSSGQTGGESPHSSTSQAGGSQSGTESPHSSTSDEDESPDPASRRGLKKHVDRDWQHAFAEGSQSSSMDPGGSQTDQGQSRDDSTQFEETFEETFETSFEEEEADSSQTDRDRRRSNSTTND